MRKKLKLFVTEIQNNFSQSFNFRIFSDSVPLLERFYAKKSGLGFIGKNTLLINPKEGSFNFLAEVIWDLEITDSKLNIVRGNCKTCTRCLDQCPTNAFNKEYVLDTAEETI